MNEHPILFCTSLVPEILADRKTVTRRIVTLRGKDGVQKDHSAWRLCNGFADRIGDEYVWQSTADIKRVLHERCPYGVPGDRLWVRETWGRGLYRGERFYNDTNGGSCSSPSLEEIPLDDSDSECPALHYFADGEPNKSDPDYVVIKHPSIHMPRWASRITLDVLSVRAERLQDITAEDVQAEGIKLPATDHGCPPGKVTPLVRVGSPYLKAHPDVKRWEEADFWRSQFSCTWDGINAKRAPWDSNPWVWRIEFRRVQP